MKAQASNLTAERLDIDGIVASRNKYQIGEWSLLYNGNHNPAQFEFSESKPNRLRIKISGSKGWVRLMRPIPIVPEPGIYTVALSLRSLTENPKSSCQPYMFSSRTPNLFEKHSKLLPRDGKYVTKLHLTADSPSFWIGFESLDRDIELFVGHVRLEILESSASLLQSLGECRTVDLPLVFSESKSRPYAAIAERNESYHERIKKDELPFLIEYAMGLRTVEMPETFVRVVRYLVVKYASLSRPQQASLAGQVRVALMISQDEKLAELVNEHCPELMLTLDVSAPMMTKFAGLAESDSGGTSGPLARHAFYAHQDDPALLFSLVHREVVRNSNFLRSNPYAYCALANAYVARPGSESRYVAFVNKYLEAYQLPALLEARFDREVTLGGLRFAEPTAIEHGPLVSIMMSAHNASATIGYAIESLLAQSYRNIEVLVCDDQSDDETLSIARAQASRDARVRVFRSIRNQGTYNIRNDLIREARGEFLTFHDSDDLALPCRIEVQLETLANERAAVCFSNWARMRPDGSFVFFHDDRVNRFCVVSAMAHRSLFERMPPFRSSLVAADTEFHELCKCLLGDSEIAIVNRPLILGLWGEGSLTRRVDLTADHSGYVAPRRRAYAEIAARQRILGNALVGDEQVVETLKRLDLHREPAGVAAA